MQFLARVTGSLPLLLVLLVTSSAARHLRGAPRATGSAGFGTIQLTGQKFDFRKDGGADKFFQSVEQVSPGKLERIKRRSKFPGNTVALTATLDNDADLVRQQHSPTVWSGRPTCVWCWLQQFLTNQTRPLPAVPVAMMSNKLNSHGAACTGWCVLWWAEHAALHVPHGIGRAMLVGF